MPSGRNLPPPGTIFQNPLEALEFSRAEMAALDAVHEQQQLFLVAQRAQAQQIFRRRGRDAALALDALDQNGGGRGRNRVARGGQIIVGNVPEARHHRLKAFFDFVLAGGGNARQRAAVKGIDRRENFKTALVMAEFARELEKPFICLRPAVAEKNFAGADAFDQLGGQPALRFGEIKIRDVDQFF